MSHLNSFLSQLSLLESEGRFMEMSNSILSMMLKNIDLSPLGGKIIKFLAIPYPPCKKVMYSFLAKYSDNISNLNILATNSLLKDFQDPNPFIRRLVIKTISHIPCLFELGLQLLPQALSDTSSYVRTSAANACSLIINEDNVKENQDIINKLYEMIRDPDPTVVCSSLAALNEILYADGGVVINSKIAFYLLSRITEFVDWNMSILHMILKKYSPKDGNELVLVLNSLDEKLLDENPAVFSLAADLALLYIHQLGKGFSGDIIRQIFPHLKYLLQNSSNEILSGILELIEGFLPEHKDIFTPSYKLFFCRFCDSSAVKVHKLKILPHMIDNLLIVTEELLLQCCNGTKVVSHQAVHSFVSVVGSHSETKNFIGTFASLIDIEYNNIGEEVLNALTKVNLHEVASMKHCVIATISTHANSFNSLKSKLSLLKFIGDYGEEIEDSPYIIEKILGDTQSFDDVRLTCTLLTTTVKLFLRRPAEMQGLSHCLTS
ncbi:hypothetical protein JTE90_006813 [Oedothorax gibbosus]|uniref:Clathrin/coatomer adaptor adaptin-like N-terminal domain-containing protein n=1 Tax=Oedothorax gibbosus TaxID=931172 RepID=A0AAV6VLV9_9ARAC|nr:hypothetical protein JTE90_006813 [Oedothorax gibbosus]